ncbi:acyl-CoA dehydrogenase family protein [Sphingomonas profundi]|uniref:acyl-CoA dehydrogenase family protein n=1 Tax=Alterirhizorhabdus profundi TaxID=2681549 RepID=UPI0012E87418|nr:acyl-CoA dehydrogenase family protein [Sphingomonas profundi]
MDFDLTDEQRMLGDSVTRFVAERYDFESRAHLLRSETGWSREIWREMADLGLLGLAFAEQDGGFGAGGVETMMVMEALGRGLVLEPYLSTIVLGGGVLRHGGTPAQRSERIPAIVSGEWLLALAHHEPKGPRFSLGAATRAERTAAGWRIEGRKVAVVHGADADELIVSAITDEGLKLFLVPAAMVERDRRVGYDGVPLADVALNGVELGADAVVGDGATLARVIEEANAALVAEAVGIMADTLDRTTEYLKTRVQFGVSIGSFQALQHRAVDMLIQLELARSMSILAALSLDQPVETRRRNIAAAKVQIGRSGRIVGQQAVQLHGAIGITAEYKVGHAFKRLTAIDAAFGDADWQIDMLAEAGGLTPA